MSSYILYVLLQIESKISARRLSDFHPNFGQVIHCLTAHGFCRGMFFIGDWSKSMGVGLSI